MRQSSRPSRALTHGWPSAFLLLLALLAAAMAQCSEALPEETTAITDSPAQQAPTPDTESPTPPEQSAAAAATPLAAGDRLKIDLSYLDKKSPAYGRFRSFVDAAVAGSPGYAFSASDAALMHLLSGGKKYCELAVRMVEAQVSEAETTIAGGGRPAISGDSYLEVGPHIADLALTLHSCSGDVSAEQRKRWSAYAEQAVWNVWHHDAAQWGGRPHPWTGWSVDNPGNNYYYSFLEATMYWALVSGSDAWLKDLREHRLPALKAYYAKLPGGGSQEGTGYGAAQMRLFALYRLWRDSTGEDLAGASSHAHDSIAYWTHATVPTLDRFAPIGDQARNSVPELYDYHRRLVLEARQLTQEPAALAMSSWWLDSIAVRQMSGGFNSRYDLLAAGGGGAPPTALSYYAQGTGHFFARTGWDKDAMWISFVAGPYNESHAHQDQGSFTLFARDWLVVTENIWSHSGIQQGTEVHNVVRFERNNASASQCAAPRGDAIVHQCESPQSRSSVKFEPGTDGAFTALADLTPVYRGNPALKHWERQLDFASRKLKVTDRFELGSGTRAVFQLNVPVKPAINGNEATAGRLHVRVLEPANATLSVHDWSSVDAQEFRRGWRIDIAGGESGYVVELSEK
ncbi:MULTISPECIES: hypothetical protein [unclassified Pseudoxanthomonas]|uniref:hypothetical protein n=1 Tax=unclassified Pseudoxanthomonas TaxID=2645906 RepID=UPI0030774EF8